MNNNSKYLYFSFKTFSLNNLLNFSINLIHERNKPLELNIGETKISILNFKMSRKLRPTKSAQRINHKLIGLMLEEIE